MKLSKVAVIGVTVCGMSNAFADSCSEVLIPDIVWERSDSTVSLAWMQLIDESNYQNAKTKAGGRYKALFSGDFSTFKEKRKALFKQTSYQYDAAHSVEILKSAVSEAAIAAWTRCKLSASEIAITYKQVPGDNKMVVQLEWSNRFQPELRDVVVRVNNGRIAEEKYTSPHSFIGTEAFSIVEIDPTKAVSGTVNAKAGTGDTAALIFVAPHSPTEAIPPKKAISSIDNRVARSYAYWREGSRYWECLAPPTGTEIVIVKSHPVRLGKRRGACVGTDAAYCDSKSEYCVDVHVDDGCYVNSSYLEWYKKDLMNRGMIYDPASPPAEVCVPEE